MMHTRDIVVIGGGPAGLAAAISARKTAPSARILVLERDTEPGGILRQCIHNGFGLHYFGEELTGPEYAFRFTQMAHEANIEVWCDTMALSLRQAQDGKTLLVSAASPQHGLAHLNARAVVLAMGCRERTRGSLSIPGSRPAGIYTAGCAQRLVNMEGVLPGRNIVILGSGDIGLIMARRLTWEGARVNCVCELMPTSSGLARNIQQCLIDNDIPLYLNRTVTQIHGDKRVTGVTVSDVDPVSHLPLPDTESFIACDTLLLSVGLIPENELTRSCGISMNEKTGGPTVDSSLQTSLPGVYACGNVLHVHGLVDNATLESERAGSAAAAWLIHHKPSLPSQ